MNISLHKEFAFGEDKSFDVRADFFERLEQIHLQRPRGDYSKAGFGEGD